MGMYAHILKNWEKHNPEKVFCDAALVSFRINAMFQYGNIKSFYNDGRFKHTSIGIIDAKLSYPIEEEKQFIFNIQGVDKDDIAVGLDKDFDYLVPDEKVCSLAYIEKVREGNTKLILDFAYEYFKINTDEYFWFEWDYAFTWKDIKGLKEKPFDKDWCFRKP